MQNTQNKLLSLKDAAAVAGVNRMTIWRAAVKGDIEHLAQEQSGKKKAIFVRRESLLAWIESRPVQPGLEVTEQVAHVEHGATNGVAQGEQIEQPPVTSELALQVINKALDRAEQAEQRFENALARAELAERQAEALKLELRSYQRVLSEQAESLAEERACRLTLEQQQQLQLEKRVSSETVLERLPEPATSTKHEGGWGKRLRRWFTGERTG